MDVFPVLKQQLGNVASVEGVLLLHQQDQKLPDKDVRITVNNLNGENNSFESEEQFGLKCC